MPRSLPSTPARLRQLEETRPLDAASTSSAVNDTSGTAYGALSSVLDHIEAIDAVSPPPSLRTLATDDFWGTAPASLASESSADPEASPDGRDVETGSPLATPLPPQSWLPVPPPSTSLWKNASASLVEDEEPPEAPKPTGPCGRTCRGKTCQDWLHFGVLHCSELKAFDCECESCCISDPPHPPPPPPLMPPAPPPQPPQPSPPPIPISWPKACGNMCRGRTCRDWHEFGAVTCSELGRGGFSCPCGGCCVTDPPSPPSPMLPAPPLGHVKHPPPLGMVIPLSAAGGAAVIVLLLVLGIWAQRRCHRRRFGRRLSDESGTLELRNMSSGFDLDRMASGDHPMRRPSEDSLPGLEDKDLPGFHYRDRPPRRPSVGSAKDRYGIVGTHKLTYDSDDSLTGAAPHTVLHNVTAAWRLCLRYKSASSADLVGTHAPGHRRTGSNGSTSSIMQAMAEAPAPAGLGELELLLEPLCDAYQAMLRNYMSPIFGSTMALAVKNDENNIDKVRKAFGKLSGAASLGTVRAVLEAERAAGIHSPGRLADPSAAVALLWMHRSLAFQSSMLDGLVSSRSGKVTDLARSAYGAHLEPYHSWLLKNTFRMALSSLPTREDFYVRLAPKMRMQDEREQICLQEIRDFAQVTGKVVDALRGLYEELGLSDERKA